MGSRLRLLTIVPTGTEYFMKGKQMKKLLATTALVAISSTAFATERLEDLHFTTDPNPITLLQTCLLYTSPSPRD